MSRPIRLILLLSVILMLALLATPFEAPAQGGGLRQKFVARFLHQEAPDFVRDNALQHTSCDRATLFRGQTFERDMVNERALPELQLGLGAAGHDE